MIPLDVEEVFGTATVDAARRGLVLFVCWFLAALLAAFSLGSGEALAAFDVDRFVDIMRRWVLLWMLPFLGLWAFLYVPVLLLASYRFFTEDALVPQPFLRFLAALSVVMLLAVPEADWRRLVALGILSGCLAGLRRLALALARHQWRRFEKRLEAIAAANRENRERLEREYRPKPPSGDDSKSTLRVD